MKNDINIFTPLFLTLSVSVAMILSTLIENLSSLVLILVNLVPHADNVIQDLLSLFISQLISGCLVVLVFIPFFKVKNVIYKPISINSSFKTLKLFFLLFGITFLSGLIFTSLYTVMQWESQTGFSEIVITKMHTNNPFNVLLFLTTVTIGAAFFEEMVYRRMLIPLLENNQLNSTIAVIISSIMFSMVHFIEDLLYGNVPGAIMHTISVFLLAIVLGIAYIETRNVIYPMIIHGVSNLLGGVNILVSLLESESLLFWFSILSLILLILGLGITMYSMWKFSWHKRARSLLNALNKDI